MEANNSEIMNRARSASDQLTREVESAERVAQAAKDLAEKWSTLAMQESERLEEEAGRKRIREDVLSRVSRMNRDELTSVKATLGDLS